MSKLPRIAVVGRPNVGKSTLFNRLAGRRLAIVSDEPGVTRDRREAPTDIHGLDVILVDTAGYENVDDGRLESRMREQTELAVKQADLVLFVYDARAGVIPLDEIFAAVIRRSNTPFILVANKCESRASDDGLNEAYSLGLGEPFAVSSEHNIGIALLEAEISNELARQGWLDRDDEDEETDDADPETVDPVNKYPLKIAVVGRPNAGKSTLINTLLGEQRLVTGPEAGVTRDSIAIDWEWNGRQVRLFDTAGMRKKAKVNEKLESLSVGDSLQAIKFAEVVVLLMDAEFALDKQDLQLADLAIREGRALVMAINKWDIVSNKSEAAKGLRDRVNHMLPQVRGVPLVLLSSLHNRGMDKLFEAIESVYSDWTAKVKTRDLNDWLREMIQKHPPPAVNGRRIKPKYITQTKARPPTFILMCSRAEKLPDSYKRYLINGLREDFGLPAVPIRLHVRAGNNPYVNDE